MIKLFCTTINNLNANHILADWQHKKAAFYHRKEDYFRSIASSLLMNAVMFDGSPAPVPSFGIYGKPYFKGLPEFNISHAGDFVVLAVAELPVGIDIEKKVKEDYLTLGKTFLCDYEYNLLNESAHPCSLFFELWTRKESYLKMTGMGFQQDPKSFCVLHDSPDYHFYTWEFYPCYAMAVCSPDSLCTKNVTLLNF